MKKEGKMVFLPPQTSIRPARRVAKCEQMTQPKTKPFDDNLKPRLGYRLFCWYLLFLRKRIFYRRVKIVHAENMPTDGPLMVVGNHQNNLFDALGLLTTVRSRNGQKPRVVSRGDMFKVPVAAKFLSWLGIIPTYRLAVDGEESLVNNRPTFDVLENDLLSDGTVIIFPEAGEWPERRLRQFSHGYLQIVFEAAEKSGFTREISVLPACIHYSDYRRMQSDMIIKYGTPVSIAPFYELYKTRPRTAKREANAAIRSQMLEMSLNISDEKNYHTINWLRDSYGILYARRHGYDPRDLDQKQDADIALFKALEAARAEDEATVQALYDRAAGLRAEKTALKIENFDLLKPLTLGNLLLRGVALLLLGPIFLAFVLPSILVITLPKWIAAKVPVPILRSPMQMASSLVFFIPLSVVLTFVCGWKLGQAVSGGGVGAGVIGGAATVVAGTFASVPAWYYQHAFLRWTQDIRLFRLRLGGRTESLARRTRELYDALDSLVENRS